jgi:large subunit ribosomal protein L24
MGLKIRRGDTVMVISGKEKGKRGEVERVIPAKERVVVSGVNTRTRHARPSQQNPEESPRGLVTGLWIQERRSG